MSKGTDETQFLGLAKTKFNSSVCLQDGGPDGPEIFLTERLNRQKCSGLWPATALLQLLPRLRAETIILENSDIERPHVLEEIKNDHFPFYDFLQKKGLERFCSKFNPAVEFVTHHLCHAYAALFMSPFKHSLIVVMDGAGNRPADGQDHEECSVFYQEKGRLTLVCSRTIKFQKNGAQLLGDRPGALYERASEYIFNTPTSSGKVMGLAAFGKGQVITDVVDFQRSLEPARSWKGASKTEWESSPNKRDYIQLAADVQLHLESDYHLLLIELKKRFPNCDNLILSGGCALNCTNNAKIYYQGLFRNIYVPPFPGDESIALGAVFYKKYALDPESWKCFPFETQAGYFGPRSSVPKKEEIERVFFNDGHVVSSFPNIEEVAATLLLEGKIIAWFQGRSESGPRALGNRSILARPDRPGLKDHLNAHIKFREGFRPYGCSVLFERSHEYFEVEEGFNNPYMSYAIRVRAAFKDRLKEVMHVDGTSRMQTVRPGQNPRFHRLLQSFGERSGLFCLLNTSLNVMGEPIVETIYDAKRFFDQSEVDALIIDNFLIKKTALTY